MISNLCVGCYGFIGKDGYCAYCGSYYPDFDFTNKQQEVEVDETPVTIDGDVYDCVLVADGEKICPITEMRQEYESVDSLEITCLDSYMGSCIYGGVISTPRICLTTLLTASTSKKLREVMNKGVVSLSIDYVGDHKTRYEFEGYVGDYQMNPMSKYGIATASFTVMPMSEIISCR